MLLQDTGTFVDFPLVNGNILCFPLTFGRIHVQTHALLLARCFLNVICKSHRGCARPDVTN